MISGIIAGITWALETLILGIALEYVPLFEYGAGGDAGSVRQHLSS